MKSKLLFASVLVCSILASVAVAQVIEGRDMIHTYWHQLDGPYWIFKPASISIANQYLYSCGADNNGIDHIIVSSDGGASWNKYNREGYPANSISVSATHTRDAYYTSPDNNVFSTFNAGGDWGAPTAPPSNLAFTVCAANPLHADSALVGCQNDDGLATAWKTEDHGATWSALGGYTNYPVTDIAWHTSPAHDGNFFIALDGQVNDCFNMYDANQSQFMPRSPWGVSVPISKVVCFDIYQGTQTLIAAIGYGDEGWAVLWSTNNGDDWHGGPNQMILPPGFEQSNVIRDISIYGEVNGGMPGFLIATDIGVYKCVGENAWEHIYNNAGDNDVYSVAFSQTTSTVYTGTMHSMLSIDTDNNFHRVNKAMFKADLKSSWASLDGQASAYTMNAMTGAIFKTHLDFSNFTPDLGIVDIATDGDTIVANISGADGEYNGLDVAGYVGDRYELIIASSKNESGEGKLTRCFDGEWRDIEIQGNPALTQLAVNGENGYGAAENGDFYASIDHGDSWNYVGRVNASHVYDLIAIGPNELVISVAGNDEITKVGYSSNGGQSWAVRDAELPTATVVNKLTLGNDNRCYAATNSGIYKIENIASGTSSWVLKNEALPAGDYACISPSVDKYLMQIHSSDFPYNPIFALYAVKNEAGRDRFFISADSARSWLEDSSLEDYGNVKIRDISVYDYNGTGDWQIQPQAGLLAATNKGLFYHPHNVINGKYKAPTDIPELTFKINWGPGLIIINDSVIVEPTFSENINNFFYPTLVIAQNTTIKSTYKFGGGYERHSYLMIKGALERQAENDNPEVFTRFVSSREPSFSNDWGGIRTHFYEAPKHPELLFFPYVTLQYCKIKDAANGIYSQSSRMLSIKYSEIFSNNETGISVYNIKSPYEGVRFTIVIDTCAIHDNPSYNIYIQADGEDVDCEPYIWNGEDVPKDPGDYWDPYGGSPTEELTGPQVQPCDFTYYTVSGIIGNKLSNSYYGISENGPFLTHIVYNDLSNLYSYGIELRNNIEAQVEKNTIGLYTDMDNLKYSGILLDNTFFVILRSNEIVRCDKAGLEVVQQAGWANFCYSNYLHDNSFSNLYINNSSPHIRPSEAWSNGSPNFLFGASVGCYILHSDFDIITQPSLLFNKIKQYDKAGVIIQNASTAIFGTNSTYGNNSICDAASPDCPQFIYSYMPPLQYPDISAIKNWWGSNDERDFRIDPHVTYTPWQDHDPIPWPDPKIAVHQNLLPTSFTITSVYPNPFNPRTQFEYYMPSSGKVTAKIYDILGRHVKTVVNQSMDAGKHTGIWDGNNELGIPVGSGIYFLQVQSANQSSSKKITLLK